ncbi:MAG: deoxyribodipyrimidine photo-lyase [Sphingomonas fennica]
MADPQIVWLRQDLRLADQPALAAAASTGPVVALYVLDDETPGDWRIGGAQRWWLHHSLAALADALAEGGVRLILRRGRADEEVARFADEIGAGGVHALRHYEPWWKETEKALADAVPLTLYDGTRLVPPDRVRTGQGGRYRMFTPFWRALQKQMPPPPTADVPKDMTGWTGKAKSDRLEDWALLPTKPAWAGGFEQWTPGEAGAADALEAFGDALADYETDRNRPAVEGTSRLSPHLHHGEVSPATVWRALSRRKAAPAFLRELAWRDFTGNVIDILPDYADENGRPAFDRMPWRDDAAATRDFTAWTEGRTGYPIVDAGMRQLWTTGWMHNRVRMIAASFSIKHLLLDWRRGEAWYWDTLVDADYGNNSVNWQWVAGTGIDSNPFGRIMAPIGQSEKFDAADYIREWVPELKDVGDDAIHDPHGAGCAPADYAKPLIGHREARERALAAAAKVKG